MLQRLSLLQLKKRQWSSEKQEVSTAAETTLDTQLPAGLRASPLARRMAEELGIDLTRVKGSGPGGRITRMDVENYRKQPIEKMTPVVIAPATPASFTEAAGSTDTGPRIIALTRLRAAIARRMVDATQQVPHFYVTHDYDVKAVMDLRKQLNALLPEDEKLSVNDFIIKAAALSLLEFPNLNASIDLVNERLISACTGEYWRSCGGAEWLVDRGLPGCCTQKHAPNCR